MEQRQYTQVAIDVMLELRSAISASFMCHRVLERRQAVWSSVDSCWQVPEVSVVTAYSRIVVHVDVPQATCSPESSCLISVEMVVLYMLSESLGKVVRVG